MNAQLIPRQSSDPLALFRRNSSQTVAASFQLQSRDTQGGQVYTRSNTTLDDLSTLLGYNAIGSGNRSTAIGAFAYAKEDSTVAMGIYAQAAGNSAVAIGDQSQAMAYQAVSIGPLALVNGPRSVGIGVESRVLSHRSVALGQNSYIGSNTASSVALGFNADCGLITAATEAVAVGANSGVEARFSTAIGGGAFIGDSAAEEAVVIGNSAEVDSLQATAIGASAFITTGHAGAIALGCEATTTTANQFMIGSATAFLLDTTIILGANAQAFHIKRLTELTTIAAAATTDTAIQIPANTIVKFVSVRTTVAIPTAATYTVTGATSGTAFNTAAVSTAANSTDKGNAAGAYYNGAAQFVRITPNVAPAANTGRVRVTICYEDVTPPTS